MNKCKCCKTDIYSQHDICPLCGKYLGTPAASETSYPEYVTKGNKDTFTIKKLFLFIIIIICTVSVYINVFTLGETLTFWSVIVSVSLISLWMMINLLLDKKLSIGLKIIYNYGIISFYIIFIDVCTGFLKWSTTYVIPFLTIAVTVIFTIMAIIYRESYREYLGLLISIFFISFCPVIIFIFSFSTKAWTGFIAILYCALTIAGLVIFSGRNFRQEIKKRFHY